MIKLVGYVLAVLVLIAGGWYFIRSNSPLPAPANQLSVSEEAPKTTQGLPGSVSASTGSATDPSEESATLHSVAKNGGSDLSKTGSTYGHAYSQAELVAMAGPVDLTSLPLGDNKYTTSGAKKGYVYICHVASGGQGAQVNGPWIHGSTWDAVAKVAVQGSVPWPNASVKITTNATTRTIASNDLPTNHNTGTFPVAASDPASQYDRNQSSITVQNNSLSLPLNPTALQTPDCIYGVVGVMTNGVSLNDAFDALYRDAPAHEEQDSCDGHPNNEEGYHYHNLSACFKSPMVDQVIGYADDGFPITGPLVTAGNYLTTSDLDECHGLTSTITLDNKQVTTYHYVMTYDFPYSVSCFRGKSYEPHPGGGQAQNTSQTQQGGGQNQSGGPPQEALDACAGKSANQSCTVATPNGSINGTCRTPPNSSLACVPN